MKHQAIEQLTLLRYVIKWVVWATIVGGLVGLSTTLFLTLLQRTTDLVASVPHSVFLLPFGLVLSSWVTRTFAPEAGGQGVERVIQAIHYRSGTIQGAVIPIKAFATLCTVSVGGSVGSVGPCAQIGGGLISLLADLGRFSDDDRKTLVICGISAGFASVMGTPLAGALFGIEVLCVGSLVYQSLLPSIIAAIVGHQVALLAGVSFSPVALIPIPPFSLSALLWIVVSGVAFGLIAFLLIEGMALGTWLAIQLRVHVLWKSLIGGIVIVVIALFLTPHILGSGSEVIRQTFQGDENVWYLFLLKILVTSVTLNFGGSGGIIMPICFVGATAGSFFGTVFEISPAFLAALGFAGLLAGAINTPITAVFVAIELFGLSIGPYVVIICAISFLMSGHRSAIPTQLLQFKKASTLRGQLHQEIGQANSGVNSWMSFANLFRRDSDRE